MTDIEQNKKELAIIEEFLNATPNSPMAGQMCARKEELQVLIQTGGGAVIAGNVYTSGGDFVGRDKINISLTEKYWRTHHLSPTDDEKIAAEKYLRYLFDRHRYLNFRGMGVSDRIPLKLPLLDIYVPLKARRELPEGETWERAQLGGRELKDEEGEVLRMSEPQPVLKILRNQAGLVILGDPGSGKTTFLKYLTLMLASGKGEELGLGERLPILVPLSAYANALSEKKSTRLDDFIADYFHEIGSNLPIAKMLSKSLKAGAALILFDGLDEVKEVALRQTVVDRVTDFYSLHHRSGNKFLITSRVIGYREVRPMAEGLGEATLVDFDDDEIEKFIVHWVLALETQAQGENQVAQEDAQREQKSLLTAIKHNSGVRRLASNPLLLTILALMKRQGVSLPERRVQLYDKYMGAFQMS